MNYEVYYMDLIKQYASKISNYLSYLLVFVTALLIFGLTHIGDKQKIENLEGSLVVVDRKIEKLTVDTSVTNALKIEKKKVTTARNNIKKFYETCREQQICLSILNINGRIFEVIGMLERNRDNIAPANFDNGEDLFKERKNLGGKLADAKQALNKFKNNNMTSLNTVDNLKLQNFMKTKFKKENELERLKGKLNASSIVWQQTQVPLPDIISASPLLIALAFLAYVSRAWKFLRFWGAGKQLRTNQDGSPENKMMASMPIFPEPETSRLSVGLFISLSVYIVGIQVFLTIVTHTKKLHSNLLGESATNGWLLLSFNILCLLIVLAASFVFVSYYGKKKHLES